MEQITSIFARRGAEAYLGEAVTMAEHMLQAAALARAEGADTELVAAALLHDIGHFTGELGTYSPSATIDHRHEREGARMLHGHFPARVISCVSLHVAAKRYLCAVDADYFALLSAASMHTLSLQGGPMTAAEIAEFEAQPFSCDAIRLRKWDEAAKVANCRVPPVDHYVELLNSLVC